MTWKDLKDFVNTLPNHSLEKDIEIITFDELHWISSDIKFKLSSNDLLLINGDFFTELNFDTNEEFLISKYDIADLIIETDEPIILLNI